MGTLALAAKSTHLPSMYLCQLPGPRQGSRQAAIAGHLEVSRRCRALGVDSLVVFDSHWLVNANDHVNCAPHFKGLDTNNELPHFISNLPYDAGIVLGGRPVKPMDLNLRWVGAMLFKNGVIEETGLAAAVLNHPATGVAWLASQRASQPDAGELGRRRCQGHGRLWCRARCPRPAAARRGMSAGVGWIPGMVLPRITTACRASGH